MKDLTYQQSSGEHVKKTRWAQHREDRGQEGDRWMEKHFAPGTVPPPPFLSNPVTAHKAVEKAPACPDLSLYSSRPTWPGSTFRLVAKVGRWWWWQGSYLQLLKLSTTLDMGRGKYEEERCTC